MNDHPVIWENDGSHDKLGPKPYWHPFLGAIEASQEGRDMTEWFALVEMWHSADVDQRIEMLRQQALQELEKKRSEQAEAKATAEPEQGTDEPWMKLEVAMPLHTADEVLNAWNHYMDHSCDGAVITLDAFLERIIELMLGVEDDPSRG